MNELHNNIMVTDICPPQKKIQNFNDNASLKMALHCHQRVVALIYGMLLVCYFYIWDAIYSMYQFISYSISWGSPSCGGGVVHQLIHEVVTSTDDGLAGNFKAVADLKSNAFFTPRTLCTLYTWSKRCLAEMANWDLWKYEIQRQRLKFKRLWDMSLGARRAHHSS